MSSEIEQLKVQENELANSELVIALACAVGTNIKIVIDKMQEQLEKLGYTTVHIKVSRELIEPSMEQKTSEQTSAGQRSNDLMDQGNYLRKVTKCNWIMASGVANIISRKRSKTEPSKVESLPKNQPLPKTAFIIDSLKHPEEAEKLREIYPIGFYLFAINESEESRRNYLIYDKNMAPVEADRLIRRDMDEKESYGQHTRDVFELADFHLSTNDYMWDKEKSEVYDDQVKGYHLEIQIERILNLIFGHPYTTPTFDEYAMFMAYSSGLRSADLSRQVGAVIAKGHDIIATGANDVPAFGGGQYWPDDITYKDIPNGRDYVRGYDSNKVELHRIINEIVDLFDYTEGDVSEVDPKLKEQVRDVLLQSSLKDLTEFGRPVHAEMAAIMSCARNGISLKGATLYCSTFPCHNCAKHIISAGISRVVYIEPYPKSKTQELYNDSISITNEENKVGFQEFVGIGPRRFYDLFSMRLSTGSRIKRKDKDGNCITWSEKEARVRCQMLSTSYLDKELMEAVKWEAVKEKETIND